MLALRLLLVKCYDNKMVKLPATSMQLTNKQKTICKPDRKVSEKLNVQLLDVQYSDGYYTGLICYSNGGKPSD